MARRPVEIALLRTPCLIATRTALAPISPMLSHTDSANRSNGKANAFVAPFVLYLVGTSFIARFGDEWYHWTYSLVALVVLVSCIVLLRGKQIIKPHTRVWPGVLLGVAGIVLWIACSKLHLERFVTDLLPSFLRPGDRVGYNPFEALESPNAAWCFIAVRMLGIAVLVPIAEELFWRGFLLRWLIDPDWDRVKMGEFTWQSCWIVVLMFTLAHPEWLAAAIYCLLINSLLYWKKDLWQCIVAHAVSNALLAIYVLNSGEWWLW